MRKYIGLFLACIFSLSLSAQTKTIVVDANGSGDYTTVRAAFNSLNGTTITQPHVIKIKAGWYDEWCQLKNVKGTSSTNTITIESFTGDSSDVWITNDTTSIFQSRGVFDLADVSHVLIQNISYRGPLQEGTTVGIGANVSNLEFRTCHFVANSASSKNNFAITPLIDFTGSATRADDVTVTNCHVEDLVPVSDGYGLIKLHNLTVRGNVFEWSSSAQPNAIFSGEDILIENNEYRYTTMGVFLGNAGKIRNNKVVARVQCIQIAESDLRSTPIQVYNNFIIGDGATAMVISGKRVNVYYNNFNILNSKPYQSAILLNEADSLEVFNNNFKTNGKDGSCILNFDSVFGKEVQFDHNNYYNTDGFVYSEFLPQGYVNYRTLSDFQKHEPTMENNGLSVDPFYIGTGDLHVSNVSLQGKAKVISGIDRDIDGTLRDKSKPDIGADEMEQVINLTGVYTDTLIGNFYPGRAVEVNYMVTNVGGLDWKNGAWKDQVFFSKDTILSSDDIRLGEIANNFPLKAGDSYREKTSITIPIVPAGTYYVLVDINAEDLSFEFKLDDNVIVSKAYVLPVADFPDLVVDSVVVPPSIFSGKEFELTWYITNKGKTQTSGTWKDYILTSTDPNDLNTPNALDSDSLVRFKIFAPTGLKPGESYSNSMRFKVPLLYAGNLYYRVQTNAGFDILESDTAYASNGLNSVALNVKQSPLPDLIPTQLNIQKTAFSGQKIPVNYTVLNKGNLSTYRPNYRGSSFIDLFPPMWFDRVFISKSPVYTGLDEVEFKAGYSRPFGKELDADSSYTVNDSIQFDICEHGRYYVYVYTNFDKSTFELSTANNVVMLDSIDVVLEPNPDLIVQTVALPSSLASGKEIELEYTVKNDGFSSKTGRHVDQYFIHTEEDFDREKALLLGSEVFRDTLLKDQNYTKKVQLRLPYNRIGKQFITVISDITDAVCEAPNEESNLKTTEVDIARSPQPDLVPRFIALDDTIIAGSNIQIITSVKNEGEADAVESSWVNALYLTNNDRLEIKKFSHAKDLTKDDEYIDTLALYVPLNVEAGDYNWVLSADYDHRLTEYDYEQNNEVVSDKVYVRREAAKVPDLELVSLTTGTNPTAGDVIELEYTIRNNSSTTRASGWNDVAELWDENDQLVKRYHLTHIGRMLKGNTATMKQTLQLPYNFYGDAKIVYMVNDDNDPVEYERNNNSSEVSIQIEAYTPPDLVVRNLQTDKCCKVYALQSDSISIDIRNVGAGDVPGAFVSRVFLSKDQVLDKRDVSLRTFKVKDLDFPKDPTTPNILKYEVQYPNYANGDYYLIAEVDHSDTIYEAAMESNNQYASSYTINLSNEQTNLVLDSFRVSGYTGSDDAFFSVDYFGRKPIDAFLQREFESSVSLLSESGELIKVGSHSFSRTLKQGKDTFQGQLFAFVPGDITPGKYAVVVHLDNKNVVFETNDRDNRKTSAETYLFDFSTELTMDVLANDDFTEQAFNQRKFYRVKRNKDQGMLISLDMEEDRSRTEMYHRVEDIPTSLRYDNKYSSPNLADQNVVVPVIDSNVTDYIQVVANYTPAIVDHFLDPRNRIIDPQPFSILCESKTYSIHQTSPKQASVYGNTSVLVEGFDFRENTQIYLVKGNDTITPFVNEYESSSRISTVFDFRNTTPGMYDVLAETNGNTARLNAYFNVSDTIRETIAAWIESDFTPIELTTNYSTLNVHFGNYGYTDGYDYWLVVGISARRYKTKYLETKYVGSSEEEEIEALIKRLGIEHPNPPLDESYVDIDSIRYYAFWIPKLAAKMNTTFTFKVNSTQPDQIYINSILFPKSLSNFTITGREEDLWTCETLQEINLYAKQQLSKLGKSSGFDCNNIDMNKVHSQIMQETWKVAQSSHPGSKSVSQIAKKGVENWKKNLQDLNPKDQLKSQGKDMVKNLFKEREKSTWEVMKEGATNFFSTYEPNNAVEKVLIPQDIPFSDLTKNVFDCIDFDQVKPKEKCFRAVGVRGSDNQHYVNDCSPSAASNQNSGEKTASWDPNEIIGPEGVTPVRYVDGSDELIYTIYFENLETASAPAITVSVDNPLDTAFRLQEFGIVEIGFGDTSIAFNGENRIDTRIDLGSRYNNAALQIVAGLNTVEHSSFWELTTIDPETGNRLNNPFGGFLPPNDSTGIGEGYVRYRIKLHPHIKGGYKLPNQADIIFDQNKIISTNIWSNIVSDGSPMSWVEELPAISAETFEVNWIGTDGEIGPGINGYEVYVSDNNGPYEKWIPFTTDTTAQFTGESNHEYRFYSIGILNDGQREEVPSTYDAITTVKNSSVESVNDDQGIVVFPNPGNNQIHIVHNGSLEVSLLNLEGKEILRKTGDQHITINTSHLADGMYFVRIHSEKGVTSRRWIKQSF